MIAARIKAGPLAGAFLFKLTRAEAQLIADALAIVRPDSAAAVRRAERMTAQVETVLNLGVKS